jgi:hypothetical protein
MATSNIKPKEALYAALGIADTAFEKAKTIADGAKTFVDKNRTPRTFAEATVSDLRSFVNTRAGELQKRLTKRQRNATRTYTKLAKRGQTLVTRIRRQAATQRATDEVKTAQRQVKRTAKTVSKAASSTAEATVAAAQKVG